MNDKTFAFLIVVATSWAGAASGQEMSLGRDHHVDKLQVESSRESIGEGNFSEHNKAQPLSEVNDQNVWSRVLKFWFKAAQDDGRRVAEAINKMAHPVKPTNAPPKAPAAAALPEFDKSDPVVIEKMTAIAFEAARSDDLKTIDAYLREGFSIAAKGKSSDTLLSVAAYNGSANVVKRLLKEQAIEVDAPGRMGLTALAAASFKGENEIVQELLAAGANANATNRQGQTALMFAALTGRAECVKRLLDAGADPDLQDAAGNSAASLASKQGAEEVVTLLRQKQPQ